MKNYCTNNPSLPQIFPALNNVLQKETLQLPVPLCKT